jgi:HSP20 family protein
MENNKDFFDQLAGVQAGGTGLSNPYEPELMRANKAALATDEVEEEVSMNPVGDDTLEFDDAEGHLTIDVYQTADSIVIESTIAGVDPGDIDLAISAESVVIKGKRERKDRVRKDEFLYQECFWGRFSRSIILPQEIDPDRAQASLKNGLLKIVLPKVHRTQSKKIKVKLD